MKARPLLALVLLAALLWAVLVAGCFLSGQLLGLLAEDR
jgi:hypothetical protein